MDLGSSEGGSRDLLVCSVAERWIGLDLGAVIQIIGYQEPAIPPQKPPYIEGVIGFRGDFVALLGVRQRLGLAGPASPGKPVIVILRIGGQIVGLVVDSVVRVLSQHCEEASEPPPSVQGVRREFLRGVFSHDGRPLLWIKGESLVAPPGSTP